MDQAAFFESRDDLDLPPGCGLYPLGEGRGVTRVAHGAGCDHAHLVRHMQLHRFLEALERANGVGHCIRRENSGLEDALAQAYNLAVLMQGLQTVLMYRRDLQAD